MRKYLCLLLAAMMILLAGCGKNQEVLEEEPQAQPTQAIEESKPEAEPELEAEPTPVPEQIALLAPSQIMLESNVNRTLGVSYQFPSHWETVYGKYTLCYVEPTTQGVEPARMAISFKSAATKPGESDMQAELALFLEKLGTQYESLVPGEIKYGVSLLGEKGYRQSYTAIVNGQEVTGYVVMAYTKGNIYLLHMSGETQRFNELNDVWYDIRMAVLPL